MYLLITREVIKYETVYDGGLSNGLITKEHNLILLKNTTRTGHRKIINLNIILSQNTMHIINQS
jgi:hypothetical protein